VCLGVIAVQGWRWWSAQQADRASVLYNAVSTATRANDVAKAKDAMTQLADKYGGTAYTPRAALVLAATLHEAGDKAGAKAQLAAVIDRDSESELKEIARLRLAALLMDDKQYDDALRTLDAKHDEAFAGSTPTCAAMSRRRGTQCGSARRPTRPPLPASMPGARIATTCR
jgi:predicted negative regulator of RcsB-dependent stress response